MLGLAQKMFLNTVQEKKSDIRNLQEISAWPLLDRLLAQNRLAYVDYALAEKLLCRSEADEAAGTLLCHLSLAVRQGHVCISVDEQDVYPDPLVIWKESTEDPGLDSVSVNDDLVQIKKLIIKGAASLPPEIAAICRKGPLFYFQRYWHYESQLVKHLKILTNSAPKLIPDRDLVRNSTEKLTSAGKLLEEQAKAIVMACEGGLSIISGGPGTGKTYTAGLLIKTFWESLGIYQPLVENAHLGFAKAPGLDDHKSPHISNIGRLMIVQPRELSRSPNGHFQLEAGIPQSEKCEIALAAPTGKAASNLQSSLLKAAANFPPLQKLKAKTLHNLLGLRGGKTPRESIRMLSADVIVVDECSMIDVRLMSYLFAAIKPGARLILLGDPHQLPAVEAGSVFSDIIRASKEAGLPIVTELQKCLRTELQDIIDFAQLVNGGKAELAVSRLSHKEYNGVSRLDINLSDSTTSVIQNTLVEIACRNFKFVNLNDPEKLFQHFNGFRILSPLRRGAFGFEEFNRRILKSMCEQAAGNSVFIAPIMLVSNDSRLELFNGEVGVLIRPNFLGPDDMSIKSGDYALFPAKDNSQGLRKIPALLLPAFEYAYCMSVHKSQGSEFAHVLLLMPPGAEVFGREVLYTAVTRAKQRLEIWGSDEVLEATIKKKSHRLSGIHL